MANDSCIALMAIPFMGEVAAGCTEKRSSKYSWS